MFPAQGVSWSKWGSVVKYNKNRNPTFNGVSLEQTIKYFFQILIEVNIISKMQNNFPYAIGILYLICSLDLMRQWLWKLTIVINRTRCFYLTAKILVVSQGERLLILEKLLKKFLLDILYLQEVLEIQIINVCCYLQTNRQLDITFKLILNKSKCLIDQASGGYSSTYYLITLFLDGNIIWSLGQRECV